MKIKRHIPKKGKIFPNVRREIAVKNTKNFFEKNVECSSMTSECHFGFFMFKKHKNPDAFVYFFSFVSFLTKFLTKNRTIWTIYKRVDMLYNTKAVGGTNSTASRTTVFIVCGVSILWHFTASIDHGCAFLNFFQKGIDKVEPVW